MVGLDPGMVAQAMDHLARGAERAGRAVGDLPITLVCGGILAQDRETALELARPLCWGQIHHPVHGPRLERAGLKRPTGIGGPRRHTGGGAVKRLRRNRPVRRSQCMGQRDSRGRRPAGSEPALHTTHSHL